MGAFIEGRMIGGDIPDPGTMIPPALEAAVTESVLLVERRTKLKTPVGVTGHARQSIGHKIRRGGAIGRGVRIRAEVGSPARYVSVLAGGRRKGAKRPPARALELWVRRKLGVANRKQARAIAFVIARKIGKKGMDALEMFDEAATESEADIQRIFDRAGLNVSVKLTRGGGR